MKIAPRQANPQPAFIKIGLVTMITNAKRARNQSKAGLGLVELIAILAVVALLLLIGLPYLARSRVCGSPIRCVNHLKNVGLAFRIYATDNNDLFPGQGLGANGFDAPPLKAVDIFRALSNELSTPKIVICPTDSLAREATNWSDFDAKSLSYFASLSASESKPNMFLAGDRFLLKDGKPIGPSIILHSNTPANLSWFGQRHGHGQKGYNIAMADGTVNDFSSSELAPAVCNQGTATNHLVMPGY